MKWHDLHRMARQMDLSLVGVSSFAACLFTRDLVLLKVLGKSVGE